MKERASGELGSVRLSDRGPRLPESPLLFTPWTGQLLEAFGGSRLHVRRFLASIALTAGAFAMTPVLDAASYLFRSQPWAGGLYRVAGFVFVTGAAMSLAASVTSLGGGQSADETSAIRPPRRDSVLLTATVLGVTAAAVYRFLPGNPSPTLTLVALDLALLALFALSGPAGTGARRPGTTVPAARPADGPDERKAA